MTFETWLSTWRADDEQRCAAIHTLSHADAIKAIIVEAAYRSCGGSWDCVIETIAHTQCAVNAVSDWVLGKDLSGYCEQREYRMKELRFALESRYKVLKTIMSSPSILQSIAESIKRTHCRQCV